ncbi:MAG: DHHA1 domain-containing protein [Thermosphaera sp.]|nr:DHHA1 domain-containing protein [Thermosphaera sp.]
MAVAIITHTDMDGAGAAGLYIYLSGIQNYKLFFTEPYLLNKTLARVLNANYERLVLLDIGINPSVYSEVVDYISRLRKRGVSIAWFDHHIWSEEWLRELRDLGMDIFNDKSTCATGVVAKYVEPRRNPVDLVFVSELVKGVCAGDLWRFDHWMGGYYLRLVRRVDSNTWRRNVVKTIAEGRLWSSEFDEKILTHVESELKVLSCGLSTLDKYVNGLKIVVAENNEEVENSFIAAFLIGRYSADIAVLASIDGKLSFRSRSVNVREIAVRMGGGGHVYASGAKIEVPLMVRLLGRIERKTVLSYVLNRVADVVANIPRDLLVATQ